MKQIISRLAAVAVIAKEKGAQVGMEQMYNPCSPPWTIEGTLELLKSVYREGKAAFYTTIDVGHMTGQRKFLRPAKEEIIHSIEHNTSIYLGAEQTRLQFEAMKKREQPEKIASEIEAEMQRYPYLFGKQQDGDPYAWLEKLGCYSPIVHLQQTNRESAHHAPFTEPENEKGIIKADQVLQAILQSYQKEEEQGMPPRVEAVYLCFEIFAANTDTSDQILKKMKKIIGCWRKYIPEDGVFLDEIPCVRK